MFQLKIDLKKILKVFLLLALVALLGYGGWIVVDRLTISASKVRVTNVSSQSATISWVTNRPDKGVVYVSTRNTILPFGIGATKGYDDRDYAKAFLKAAGKMITSEDILDVNVTKTGKYYTHHVTVQNLTPETSYNFRISNGLMMWNVKRVDQEVSEFDFPVAENFAFTTFKESDSVGTPNPAYGKLATLDKNDDGMLIENINTDGIIFLKAITKDSTKTSLLLSSSTNTEGGWTIDKSNFRLEDGTLLTLKNGEDYLLASAQFLNIEPKEVRQMLGGIEDNPMSPFLGYEDTYIKENWKDVIWKNVKEKLGIGSKGIKQVLVNKTYAAVGATNVNCNNNVEDGYCHPSEIKYGPSSTTQTCPDCAAFKCETKASSGCATPNCLCKIEWKNGGGGDLGYKNIFDIVGDCRPQVCASGGNNMMECVAGVCYTRFFSCGATDYVSRKCALPSKCPTGWHFVPDGTEQGVNVGRCDQDASSGGGGGGGATTCQTAQPSARYSYTPLDGVRRNCGYYCAPDGAWKMISSQTEFLAYSSVCVIDATEECGIENENTTKLVSPYPVSINGQQYSCKRKICKSNLWKPVSLAADIDRGECTSTSSGGSTSCTPGFPQPNGIYTKVPGTDYECRKLCNSGGTAYDKVLTSSTITLAHKNNVETCKYVPPTGSGTTGTPCTNGSADPNSAFIGVPGTSYRCKKVCINNSYVDITLNNIASYQNNGAICELITTPTPKPKCPVSGIGQQSFGLEFTDPQYCCMNGYKCGSDGKWTGSCLDYYHLVNGKCEMYPEEENSPACEDQVGKHLVYVVSSNGVITPKCVSTMEFNVMNLNNVCCDMGGEKGDWIERAECIESGKIVSNLYCKRDINGETSLSWVSCCGHADYGYYEPVTCKLSETVINVGIHPCGDKEGCCIQSGKPNKWQQMTLRCPDGRFYPEIQTQSSCENVFKCCHANNVYTWLSNSQACSGTTVSASSETDCYNKNDYKCMYKSGGGLADYLWLSKDFQDEYQSLGYSPLASVTKEEDCGICCVDADYSGRWEIDTCDSDETPLLDSGDNLVHVRSKCTDPVTLGVSTKNVLGAESENTFVRFFPEAGAYAFKYGGIDSMFTVNDATNAYFYLERNGKEGYQAPSNPDDIKPNEDLLIDFAATDVEISKLSEGYGLKLKKGVNIVSFPVMLTTDGESPLMASQIMKLFNLTSPVIQHISYFEGGAWDAGIVYSEDASSGYVGNDFPIVFGKGYLIIANTYRTTILPAYDIEESIPIAFSAGWNLVGVNGYDTTYTASSIIDSINTLPQLTADNVTWWPTSKGRYEGFQKSEGVEYGFDYPIAKDLGYFIRISEFKPDNQGHKSYIWNPGGDLHGLPGSN